MKFQSLLALGVSAPLLASALYIPTPEQSVLHSQQAAASEQYLVEFGPGRTEWVTEDDKWELRRRGINFMVVIFEIRLGNIFDLCRNRISPKHKPSAPDPSIPEQPPTSPTNPPSTQP